MGIQINGQTDTISAVDGALTVSGAELSAVTNLNATGIVTATSFSGPLTGNATGLSGNPSISVSTIGVNGASPQTPIDAISNSSGNGITVRGRGADGLGNIRFTSNNYATLYGGFKHDASTLTIFNELSGSLKLGTNGIDRATIDGSGRLTLPYQPAFFSRPTGNYDINVGETTIGGTWNDVFDRGNNFSNGTFTAPVAGVYQFSWAPFLTLETTRQDAYIMVNGTGVMREEISGYNSTSNRSGSVHGIYQLSANDAVTFGVYSTAGNTIYFTVNPWCYACGYLIG